MNARYLLDHLFDLQKVLNGVVLPERARLRGDKLVRVNARFDHFFAAEPDFYVGPNGTGAAIRGRIPGLHDWLKKGLPMEASEVSVSERPVLHRPTNKIQPIQIGFINGRHRYSVLRDAGAEAIPVAMDPQSIEVAARHGLLA